MLLCFVSVGNNDEPLELSGEIELEHVCVVYWI